MQKLHADGREYVYSYEIANVCAVTPEQVRRDLMPTRLTGSPTKGYKISALLQSIGLLLGDQEDQRVALVGVGNLGRAILAYFAGRRPNLSIVAAFDQDPDKTNRVIHGCRCYPIDDLPAIVREQAIEIAILAVPVSAAQTVADRLIASGVRGLLNFAPVSLRLPRTVYAEDLDMAISLERVAYFARHPVSGRRLERAIR
jgi:redox-sensing transcriptional repressor